MNQRERGERFHELHRSGTFVLPNAWDAASAAVMVGAGAQAIATTSSGISWSQGVPDGENLSRDDMIAAIARIARAVDVPVTGDVEAGYGPATSDVVATVEALIDAGAVGMNIEDRLREASSLRWWSRRLSGCSGRRTRDRRDLARLTASTSSFREEAF